MLGDPDEIRGHRARTPARSDSHSHSHPHAAAAGWLHTPPARPPDDACFGTVPPVLVQLPPAACMSVVAPRSRGVKGFQQAVRTLDCRRFAAVSSYQLYIGAIALPVHCRTFILTIPYPTGRPHHPSHANDISDQRLR